MNRIFKKTSILSLVLVIALIAAMALILAACDTNPAVATEEATQETTQETISDTTTSNDASETPDENVVGVGNTSFVFTVKLKDGTTRSYTVKTDKTTVGEALVDAGLISGRDSQYGLMVDTVCGEKLVYNTDKMYWAFYEDGKYANAGVDSTEIKPNVVYSFEATAG